MKKLKLSKLLVGVACLGTLASCNASKEECFNPKIARLYGITGDDLEVIGEVINGYVTFNVATKFIEKAESKGYKKFKEELEHGVVCEKCYSWEDDYLWNKSNTCDCGGKYHDCDLKSVFYYIENTNLEFWIKYVNGKYSGDEDIWTQR